jgi:nucleolar protein 4
MNHNFFCEILELSVHTFQQLPTMGERRKRQRLSEDGTAAVTATSDDEPIPSTIGEKHRKETGASARRSLFVRSLSATVTSESLTQLFSQNYPLKHATVVLDPITQQSKGYGFVTFTDADDAQKAKDEFHGHIFQGRKLKVEIAEPRHRDSDKKIGLGGKGKSGVLTEAHTAKKAREEKLGEARKPPKLIVRNLPWSIKTSDQLAALFLRYGKVKHSTLPKIKGTQAGFGFVMMRGKKNAEKALAAINGQVVDGRTLAVDWAVEKEVWEKQKTADDEVEERDHAENAIEEDENISSDGQNIAGSGGPISFDTEDDVANFMKSHFNELEEEDEDEEEGQAEEDEDDLEGSRDEDKDSVEEEDSDGEGQTHIDSGKSPRITDNSSTLFIRNLPFTTLDSDLKEHFMQFGPVRYARVVMDRATDRPRGTGFVCFFNVDDADKCFRGAPRYQMTGANTTKKGDTAAPLAKHSILENEAADTSGMYTIDGRILQVARAVERDQAAKITEEGTKFRDHRDKDKRRLYLLSEGTVAAGTPLYAMLAPSEVKMREDSAMQRKKLIQNNPTLHLSLTRLSVRNIPRNITSKDLKALAREAVVGFAKDVKNGTRAQLSKEEEARGGEEMREAEKQRKAKGKGIVRQSKIVFEGREGAKVSEDSGAGRSRGYGFIEYSSHRWALMGLRWLNGHAVESAAGKKQRLIVEFAIENAQVVSRRKEREEKARIRSKEVLEARAKGEAPEKEKKVLSRDTLMAKTRKGTKAGGKGRTGNAKQALGKPNGKFGTKGGDRQQGVKRKRDSDEGPNGKGLSKKAQPATNGDAKKLKPGFPPGEEGRLARRQQIIAKKRLMRRARKKGGNS